MARHPNIVAPPQPGSGQQERWIVEGKVVTYKSLLSRAADRGVKISKETIQRRLERGIKTFDELLAPPAVEPHGMTKALQSKREREKAEMARLLAQMGPPKRY